MKRVYCLYRVSTLGQVDKDDIPMQRQACHGFAHEKGWQIIEEFAEKGISGYKRSADQREALQKLKQAAVQKKFDVLLVFMFDRLGRTNKKGYDIYDLIVDSETSLVVKEIFHLYCYEKEGTHRISTYLNRRGHRTKQGALWNSASVRNILLNPAYIGIRHFGKASWNPPTLGGLNIERRCCFQSRSTVCTAESASP